MSGLLSCLGYPVTDEKGFLALLEACARKGERVEAVRGCYRRWSPGGNVEIWVQENEAGELVGLNPFYAGANRVPVLVRRAISLPRGGEMDGAFLGSVGYQDELAPEREFDILFEAPDILRHPRSDLPGLFPVRLSAFAFALQVFADVEEFRRVGGMSDAGPDRFLAHGLYTEEGEYAPEPEAHAIFSGRVLECARRTNPETGVVFQWALVETREMKVEVVGATEDIVGEVEPGRIVQGSFWLAGRLLEV